MSNDLAPEDIVKFKLNLGEDSRKLSDKHDNNKKLTKKKKNVFRKVINSEDEKQKIKFAMPQVNHGDTGDIEMENMTDEPSKPEKTSKKGKKHSIKSHKNKKKIEEDFEEEDEKLKPNQEPVQIDINIGNIKELEKIGKGSFALVEKAILIPSNIIIALKVKLI